MIGQITHTKDPPFSAAKSLSEGNGVGLFGPSLR